MSEVPLFPYSNSYRRTSGFSNSSYSKKSFEVRCVAVGHEKMQTLKNSRTSLDATLDLPLGNIHRSVGRTEVQKEQNLLSTCGIIPLFSRVINVKTNLKVSLVLLYYSEA